MIVFSYGIPKSGSTLAFKITTCIATLGGHRQILLPGTLLPAALRKGIRDKINFADHLDPDVLPRLIDFVGDRVIIIKTHASPSLKWIEVYNEFARLDLVRAHVNHRDPRDICLSLIDAGTQARRLGCASFSEFTTLSYACSIVKKYLEEIDTWNCLQNKVDIRYETCAFDIDNAINQIKNDLKLSCPNFLVRFYINRLAFTQKNLAIPKRFENELSKDSIQCLSSAFSSYLERMNYPSF